MSKKTRYVLIAIGFVIFLLLAPTIVLYVQGINYDYSSGTFYRTGILATRSEPAGASIVLDGKTVRTSSGDIKFLKPAEYNVTVSADGFQDWNKRLTIWSNQVTWTSPAPNKIFLFLKDLTSEKVASQVSDFVVSGKSLLSVSPGNLAVSTLSSPQKSENFNLPKNIDSITAAPNGDYFVLTNKSGSASSGPTVVFNAKEKKIHDISLLFSNPVKLAFNDNSSLYGLSNNTLYQIDWQNGKKTQLLSGIRDFSILGATAYVLEGQSSSLTLSAVQLPGQDRQILATALPAFNTSSILVNQQKQIFLVLDDSLYHVNSGLQKIAGNISDLQFEPGTGSLILAHAGEISNYNFLTNKLDFVTRSSQNLTNPRLNQYTDYAFFFKDKSLIAAELDTRDHQNQYTLYAAENPQKFFVDQEAKTLVVLDNGDLKVIKIRK